MGLGKVIQEHVKLEDRESRTQNPREFHNIRGNDFFLLGIKRKNRIGIFEEYSEDLDCQLEKKFLKCMKICLEQKCA